MAGALLAVIRRSAMEVAEARGLPAAEPDPDIAFFLEKAVEPSKAVSAPGAVEGGSA